MPNKDEVRCYTLGDDPTERCYTISTEDDKEPAKPAPSAKKPATSAPKILADEPKSAPAMITPMSVQDSSRVLKGNNKPETYSSSGDGHWSGH